MTSEADKAEAVFYQMTQPAGGSHADAPATGLAPRRDGRDPRRDPRRDTLIALVVGEPGVVGRAMIGNDLHAHLDTLPQPAVDVDALADKIADALFGKEFPARRAQEDIATVLRAHLAQPAPGVVEALDWLDLAQRLAGELEAHDWLASGPAGLIDNLTEWVDDWRSTQPKEASGL